MQTRETWTEKRESRGVYSSALVPPCRCCVAVCWRVMQDLGVPLGSRWGSGNEGYCFLTQPWSLSLKSPSWNVSPACHVCALAVLTGCQSTHTQTSVRGQCGYIAQWCLYQQTTRYVVIHSHMAEIVFTDKHSCKYKYTDTQYLQSSTSVYPRKLTHAVPSGTENRNLSFTAAV